MVEPPSRLPSLPTIGASALRAAPAMSLYFTVLAFGAVVCGAVLRRHLMVSKIFAPRKLGDVFELCVVDFGVLVGVGVGVGIVVAVGRIEREIGKVFGRVG